MPKAIRVTWLGARPPTAAERAAIAKAAERGDLKDGATAAPGRAVRKSRAEAAFRKFHWGRRPRKTRRVRLPDYGEGLFALGKLRAVEYETRKGDQDAIWVHKFDRPFPILTGTPSGRLGPIIGGGHFITARGIER